MRSIKKVGKNARAFCLGRTESISDMAPAARPAFLEHFFALIAIFRLIFASDERKRRTARLDLPPAKIIKKVRLGRVGK